MDSESLSPEQELIRLITKYAIELLFNKIVKKYPEYFDNIDMSTTMKIVNLKGPSPSGMALFEPDPVEITLEELLRELMVLDLKNFHAFYVCNHEVIPQDIFRVIYTERFFTFSEEMVPVLLASAGATAKKYHDYKTKGELERYYREWWIAGSKRDFHTSTFIHIMGDKIKYDEDEDDWVELYKKNKEYFSILETEFLGIEAGTLVEVIEKCNGVKIGGIA